MNKENYSRRRFVRHGLTLAGVTFAWSTFRSNSSAREAKTGQPASPDEALAELSAGNKRYATGRNIHHDFGPERPALAQSQHPFAIILGCADSRVAPELAFDQSRGRLFVVRLAGNFVDDNAIRENVLLNVETLRNAEPVLADLVKQNRLHVVGGLYDLATGRVEVLS
jgi:carbonic anhydrase